MRMAQASSTKSYPFGDGVMLLAFVENSGKLGGAIPAVLPAVLYVKFSLWPAVFR